MSTFDTVSGDKLAYLPLLSLAEPCEKLLRNSLKLGNLHTLRVGFAALCAAVVTPLSDAACELKNVVTDPAFQRQGHASRLMQTLFRFYAAKYKTMFVATTDASRDFYTRMGFVYSHTVSRLLQTDLPQLEDVHYFKKYLH